jgi:hypothetical protein
MIFNSHLLVVFSFPFLLVQKHRSSSKFSLQSWVGGFSGKNAPNCLHSQPSLNENRGNSSGKRRSQLPKAGGNHAVSSQGIVNSIPVLNEDKKSVALIDKCVVEQDTKRHISLPLFVTNSNGGSGDIEKTPQRDKPDVVHKIKWGDLEDDALLLHHENTVGAGIKFGDIENDNLVTSRKNMKSHGLVSSVTSCANPQENNAVAAADANICGNEVSEERCEEVNEISLEDAEVPILSDKKVDPGGEVSSCKDIHAEHVKPVNADCSSIGFPSAEEEGVVVKLQAPVIIPKSGDSDISEAPVTNQGSSTALAAASAQISELVPSKESEPEITVDSSLTAPIEDQGGRSDSTAHDDMSNIQIMNALGEGETSESKERFRQRLWCFLFENLNRAVDELYLLCELECDTEQMEEAILVLEEAASDFKELKTRVEEFENVKRSSQVIDGTPLTLKSDHRRPHALSWEVSMLTFSFRSSLLMVMLL